MGLDVYIENYDKILFLGDFNSEPSETWLNDFCNIYSLYNLVQDGHSAIKTVKAVKMVDF